MIKPKKVKVALVQHPPVFLNLDASLEKAGGLIGEAAGRGADIIVFPETWLPGYPVWLDNAAGAALWGHKGAKDLYRILMRNALEFGSKEMEQLDQLTSRLNITLVMGCHERLGHTIYNTIFYFGGTGKKITCHRKLMPTYNEKLIWGCGDGSTLDTIETGFGPLGGLICWEHWMPLARAAMHAKKETIHVAQWPSVIELHQMASRHYAFEGRCHVLASGCVMTKKDVIRGFESLGIDEPEAFEMLNDIAENETDRLMTGGSCVIAPDASFCAGPVFDEQTILYCDIRDDIAFESGMVLDPDGHYARPDVFSLFVDTESKSNVKFK